VIGIEDFRFVDDQAGRTNDTVRKISAAVRRSQIGTRQGGPKLEESGGRVLHFK